MHGNHLPRSRRVRIRDVHTTVLQTILQLLEEPNPEDALSAGIGAYVRRTNDSADQYQRDPVAFRQTAAEYTRKYAPRTP